MTATEAKVAVEDVIGLSPLQQGLFSLSKLSSGDDGADDPYVIAMSADIVGLFDPELLRHRAAALPARHPNLRASFLHGDLRRPVQVVPNRVDVPWRMVTASADRVDALDADERRRPFDLERGPAIRFLIIEVPESHWRFVVVAHHILLDGWSLPLFVGELITLYRASGEVSVLPPPPRPCNLWAAQLDGADPVLGTRRIRVAARTIDRWREHRGQERPPPLIELETHGRADGIMGDTDTSDTVGSLTAIYPLRMDSPGAIDAVPGDGIDYGPLRYVRPDTAQRLQAYAEPQVLLNFLGRVHLGIGGELRPDRALLARVSPRPEPDLAVRHELTILAAVIGEADAPGLGTQWRTLPDILSAEDVAALQAMWQDSLREVAP